MGPVGRRFESSLADQILKKGPAFVGPFLLYFKKIKNIPLSLNLLSFLIIIFI
ncbi:hypothetical protein XIS1_1250029 [Xenorhabdus innexi]|uniref:Uncharacterized protein n=1 Tax=Xenorhabdus innexi TaxID=290109 RepID=A0A1N6MSB8_9GAMM|nr:hypothetical protein XIS1_1250029 [Xenorhabdus innexi]